MNIAPIAISCRPKHRICFRFPRTICMSVFLSWRMILHDCNYNMGNNIMHSVIIIHSLCIHLDKWWVLKLRNNKSAKTYKNDLWKDLVSLALKMKLLNIKIFHFTICFVAKGKCWQVGWKDFSAAQTEPTQEGTLLFCCNIYFVRYILFLWDCGAGIEKSYVWGGWGWWNRDTRLIYLIFMCFFNLCF